MGIINWNFNVVHHRYSLTEKLKTLTAKNAFKSFKTFTYDEFCNNKRLLLKLLYLLMVKSVNSLILP
jgi:hypothetical protein